jgi:predicted chitinase
MKTFLPPLFLLLFIACKYEPKTTVVATPVVTAAVIDSIRQDSAYNDSLLRAQHIADSIARADSVRAANIADSLEFRRITKLINGGYNGFDDRWELYKRAKETLKNE